MGRKSKISSDEKLNAVTRCIYGDISIGQMAKSLGVQEESLCQWIRNYI